MPTKDPLTKGEMLTAILLAVCPTGIGMALKDGPDSLCDWCARVSRRDHDPDAAFAMQAILCDERYSPLFDALLQEPDSALAVQKQITDFFKAASKRKSLKFQSRTGVIWGDQPPHPRAAEITSLIQYLAQLPDTQGKKATKRSSKKPATAKRATKTNAPKTSPPLNKV